MQRTPLNPPLGVFASREEWLSNLATLPDREELGGCIPSFYFAHGSPSLIWPKGERHRVSDTMGNINSPDGLLKKFLADFGKTLLEKYKPRGIVVFSAHWNDPELLVTDYGDENPLLYDYYGFPEKLYEFTYRSRGDAALSRQVVDVFEQASLYARTTPVTETRGKDGRRTALPEHQSGLDHGVFIPFKTMFPDESGPFPIPIVEVSMSQDFVPEAQWEIGAALKRLREQGILILSGGLTVHDFGDFSSFNESSAKPMYHVWNDKVLEALNCQDDANARKRVLYSLVDEPEYSIVHRPTDDHFLPLYIAAGAGEDGITKILTGMYGATTVAFGL